MSSEVFDEIDDRRLCPDDSCIGVLDDDLVCPECGAFGEASPAEGARFREPSAVDLLHRSLCPDGACIGILGADGSCRECGKVGAEVTTDPRLRGLLDESESDPDADDDAQQEPEAAQAANSDPDPVNSDNDDEPSDFVNRRLCYDGGCIGVIGDNGTCNECGLVA